MQFSYGQLGRNVINRGLTEFQVLADLCLVSAFSQCTIHEGFFLLYVQGHELALPLGVLPSPAEVEGGLLKPYPHNSFCLILLFSTAIHLVPGFRNHGYDYCPDDAHQTLVCFHWRVAFLILASGRTWEWHSHLQKTILEPPPSKLAKTLTFKPKKILNPWNHLSYPSKERETQNVLCSNL